MKNGATYTVLMINPFGEDEGETPDIEKLAEALQKACNDGLFGGNFLVTKVDEGDEDFWREWSMRSLPFLGS